MTILSIAVPCLIAFLILLIISWKTGNSVLRFFLWRSEGLFFTDFFFSTLAGSTFITVLTALVLSGGKSIQWISVLILLFWYIENYLFQKNKTEKPEISKTIFTKRNFVLIIAICMMVFVWHCSIILKPGAFSVDEVEKDSFYYAEVSRCLVETGMENTFAGANLADNAYHYPTPYHYFDLWLNGFVAKIAGLNYTLCLYLVTYSFFSFLLICGFLSIIERYESPKPRHVLLCFLLLFVSGLYLSERVFNLNGSQMEGITERFGNKLLAASCFSLATIILFSRKESHKNGFLLFLYLPAVSISLAPAVYGGGIVYCLSRLLLKKEDKKFLLRLCAYSFILIIFIAGFYFLTRKNELNYRFNKGVFEYTDLKSFSFFHIKFYLVELFLKTYAQPFLFLFNYFAFAPVIFFILINKSTGFLKPVIALFIFSLCCGLFAFNSLYLMDDAGQLYTNAMILWHVLFAAGLIYFFYEVKKNVARITTGSVFIAGLFYNCIYSWQSFKETDLFGNRLSEDYVVRVNEALKDYSDSTLKGATFYDHVVYRNVFITYPLEYYCPPFILNPHVTVPFNLTNPNIQEKNAYQIEKNLSKSPYAIFLKEQQNNGILKAEALMQLDFIKKNNVKYLICPPKTQIDVLKFLKTKETITDSLSGQRFILLN